MEQGGRIQGNADKPALIFIHIPKSAGTTLNRILDWEYSPLRVYSLNGRYFRWSYQKLLQLSPQRLARIQVFKGHMPFGLHKSLPQSATYLTILRDPVDRAISEYYFALNGQLHPDHRKMNNLSLEEFVENNPYNNTQTKLLAGQIAGYDFLKGDCTSEMLETAIGNLKTHFTLVGLSERFDESLALGKILFGWKVRRYASFRLTRGRPPKSAIPPETRALLAKCNAFDMELHSRATVLFDETIAKYGERMLAQLESVRHAKSLDLGEAMYYRTASTALKALTLINSAIVR